MANSSKSTKRRICTCKTCVGLRKGIKEMTIFSKACKKNLKSFPYLNINEIIKELKGLLKNK